ncbi:tubulin-tyrosine ligase family protein [Stylonychia lemnae]|uniref:Tubulin-tyrosine ligase family protein n=1 Tax=Stylonychia lemnae TaxID=5949 RepID=A0A078AQZ0_STYLE|nr:tubulin-tyrosine ligase family protein [Stylonychia lemnae]|eukprot:CDW84366.1 tubulin-tyrosine ligase family protein [Stylonychia lemnae]
MEYNWANQILKYTIYPGNHGQEIRNILLENKNFEEIPYTQEEKCMKECNLVWKPIDLSFKAQTMWDQMNKQLGPNVPRILNNLENMRNITTKTGLIRSLRRYYTDIQEQNPNMEVTQVFDIVPTTFIVSSQYKTTDMYRFIKRFSDLAGSEGLSLKENLPAKHCSKNMWLLKPATLNQGRGIQIFSKINQIFEYLENNDTQNNYWVIQKYVERPLLFEKRKFDIRIWVLVTLGTNGVDLNLYMYQEGYLRTSSSNYDLQDENKYVHLTNNCLQQKGNQYGQHEDGNTLSFQFFQNYLNKEFKDLKIDIQRDFIPRMKDIIIDTIQSVKQDLNPQKRKNQFQLLGYDFLIDEDFRLWLLEVNNNPYLGIPNNFIQNLLPQMIRDMFKIVIPGSSYKDIDNNQNRFELILSDVPEYSQRRSFGLELLYPIEQVKQVIGKEKKNDILKIRKERFKLQQQIIQQQNFEKLSKYTISVVNDQNSRVTLNIGYLSGKKDLQIYTQKEIISQLSTGSQSSRVKLNPVQKQEEYKQLQQIIEQNQQLLAKINGRTPQISTFEQAIASAETLGLLQQQFSKQKTRQRNDNFKKDILQETKDLCTKKEIVITQSQFDYLLNKMIGKIQQWELFDDKQIKKCLDAYEVLTNSKGAMYFQNQMVIDKLIKLIENDQIPQKYRLPLFENLEIFAKALSQQVGFIENKYMIGVLQNFIKTKLDNMSDENAQKFGDISYRIFIMCLQIDQNNLKLYVPKLTKEKEQLKIKAIENGILLFLVKILLQKNLDNELQTQILSRLKTKDLHLQLDLLQQRPDVIDYLHELDFLKVTYHKQKIEQEQQKQKEKELKLKQQEDEKIMKIKYEEEKEKKRIMADE